MISVKAQGENSVEEKRLTSTLPSTGEPALLPDTLPEDDLAARSRSICLPADDDGAPVDSFALSSCMGSSTSSEDTFL